MTDDERDHELENLRLKLALLQAEAGRTRWWNVAGGIASIIGAALGALTLWGILNLISQNVSP